MRAILRAAAEIPEENFLVALRAAVAEVGGADLDLPARDAQPRAVD